MKKYVDRILGVGAGLIGLACLSVYTDQESVPSAAPRTFLLVVGKAKVGDPVQQQERAMAAPRKISEAMAIWTGVEADILIDEAMTPKGYRQRLMEEKVTRSIFKERLKRLAKTATPADTVVIYTHSHGRRNGFEESQPLGGIVLDLPIQHPEHQGTLLWDEYVDLLLEIPAKNVVVLTMACFSGGLVEYLGSPQMQTRWKERCKEGRNLIILTSQNKDLPSSPVMKDGEVINPFTYAVAKTFNGEADGFAPESGTAGEKDGRLTAGELVDYILHTTETTVSEAPRRRNSAEPQLTGSFNRAKVLFVRASPIIGSGQTQKTLP